MTAEHLQPKQSGRGFAAMPDIPGEYGGYVKVYESSAALAPHLWLKVVSPVDANEPLGPMDEAVLHMTAENAWRLAEQLQTMVREHYHGDATPDWAKP